MKETYRDSNKHRVAVLKYFGFAHDAVEVVDVRGMPIIFFLFTEKIADVKSIMDKWFDGRLTVDPKDFCSCENFVLDIISHELSKRDVLNSSRAKE